MLVGSIGINGNLPVYLLAGKALHGVRAANLLYSDGLLWLVSMDQGRSE